jgi:hypothetical protein
MQFESQDETLVRKEYEAYLNCSTWTRRTTLCTSCDQAHNLSLTTQSEESNLVSRYGALVTENIRAMCHRWEPADVLVPI